MDVEVVEALEHSNMGVVPEMYVDVHDGRVVEEGCLSGLVSAMSNI